MTTSVVLLSDTHLPKRAKDLPAALWADRLLLLHAGRLVAEGSAGEVLQADLLRRWYGAEVETGFHPRCAAPQVFLNL